MYHHRPRNPKDIKTRIPTMALAKAPGEIPLLELGLVVGAVVAVAVGEGGDDGDC